MMNLQSSSTSSTFFQSRYTEQSKSVVKKFLSFEDNVGLSEEEEDIMLAQCIRSGMPKVSCLCVNKIYVGILWQILKNEYTENKLTKDTFLFYIWDILYFI